MNKEAEIVLLYNKFCPFAQRALIVAMEKQIPTNYHSVSLKQKQKYFTLTYGQAIGRDQLSNGKVPILIHKNITMTESELVCWYLAQQFSTGQNLIPKDSYIRLKMRIWIGKIGAQLIQLFNNAKTKTTTLDNLKKQAKQLLMLIQRQIEGPYLLGQMSLADAMIYPWFQRWIIMEHYFGITISKQYPKILEWLITIQSRPSIIATKKMTSNQYYINRSQKMMNAAKL